MATTSPAEVATAPKVEEPPLSDAKAVVVSSTPTHTTQENEPDNKALAIVAIDASAAKDNSNGATDRDAALAKLGQEKTLSFIKAWLESRKAKVENKAQKRHSKVTSWENSKKASIEAQIKKMEEQLEKKKAEYAEKMKNKAVLVHKQAEEKRAMVEAKKGEEMLKAEEKAETYRTSGQVPKKGFACFGA